MAEKRMKKSKKVALIFLRRRAKMAKLSIVVCAMRYDGNTDSARRSLTKETRKET